MAGRERRDPEALVGRSVEVGRIHQLVADAVAGRSGALLLSGEAGVGKTSLVRQVVADLGDGVRPVWGACLPLLSASVPYLPLTVAWRDAVPTQALPAEGSSSRPGWLGHGSTVGVVSLAFDAWLSELCRHQPVVLVMDDLHWADPSSLDVLMYVVAGPLKRRLCVVATIREGETAPRPDVRRWLADVRRLPRVHELGLARFDRAATGLLVTRLLGRPAHDSLIDEAFARSLGNAYMVELLVRGLSADAAHLAAQVPELLQDAVARIWLDLSDPAYRLIQLVAVAGRPQTAHELRTVSSQLDLDLDVVAALREAVQRAVLVVGQGDGYWFAHPLLAEVLEQRMLPEDQRAWHGAYATTLARSIDQAPDGDVTAYLSLCEHHLQAGDGIGPSGRPWTAPGWRSRHSGCYASGRRPSRCCHCCVVPCSSIPSASTWSRLVEACCGA